MPTRRRRVRPCPGTPWRRAAQGTPPHKEPPTPPPYSNNREFLRPSKPQPSFVPVPSSISVATDRRAVVAASRSRNLVRVRSPSLPLSPVLFFRWVVRCKPENASSVWPAMAPPLQAAGVLFRCLSLSLFPPELFSAVRFRSNGPDLKIPFRW
jgi:hypothetical protein